MPNYRRARSPDGTCFFTGNLHEACRADLLTRCIDPLREAVRTVRRKHPYEIRAWVVLPDHLHCVIRLPDSDAGFDLRWRLIKARFSRHLPLTETRRTANYPVVSRHLT